MLTVNQVVDILLAWCGTRDWGAAFNSVVPTRKQQTAPAEPGPSAAAKEGAAVAGRNAGAGAAEEKPSAGPAAGSDDRRGRSGNSAVVAADDIGRDGTLGPMCEPAQAGQCGPPAAADAEQAAVAVMDGTPDGGTKRSVDECTASPTPDAAQEALKRQKQQG